MADVSFAVICNGACIGICVDNANPGDMLDNTGFEKSRGFQCKGKAITDATAFSDFLSTDIGNSAVAVADRLAALIAGVISDAVNPYGSQVDVKVSAINATNKLKRVM